MLLGGGSIPRGQRALRGLEEGLDRIDEVAESFEGDLLLTVGEGFGWIRVDFDNEPVGSHRHGSGAEGNHEIGAAAALAGIDDHREVSFLLRDGDGGEVEGVAGVGLESADAALAQQDVWVAVGEEVFGGENPFLDPLAHPALEEDGLLRVGALDEELKILRVAGTDLQNVGGLGDVLDVAFAEDLGDDFEARAVPGFPQQSEALLAETLKFVGGGAGFVSASPEDRGSRCADGFRRGEELLGSFHRAGARHHGESRPANRHAVDVDHGVLRVGRATGELVALLDAEDILYLRKGGERLQSLVGSLVTDRGDDRLLDPVNWSRFVSELADLLNDGLDLLGGGVGAEDDDHLFKELEI